MASERTDRPMTPQLRAWLERVIAGEGGVNKADEASGMPRATFSRWLSTGVTPSGENLRKVADAIGARYGVTPVQLFVMAGYLPAESTDMPRLASRRLNEALLTIQENEPLEDALAAERAALRAVEPFLPPGDARRTGGGRS